MLFYCSVSIISMTKCTVIVDIVHNIHLRIFAIVLGFSCNVEEFSVLVAILMSGFLRTCLFGFPISGRSIIC